MRPDDSVGRSNDTNRLSTTKCKIDRGDRTPGGMGAALSMGTLVKVVLILMGVSTAWACTGFFILCYLDFLVAYIQPVVHHLCRSDRLIL